MRRSLLTNLLDAAAENLQARGRRCAVRARGRLPARAPASRCRDEPRRLAIVLSGRRRAEAWDDPQGQAPAQLDFFDLKGVIERLTAALHLPAVSVRATKDVPHLHPGRAAELLVGGQAVGAFGELHPKTAAAFGLAERTVLVAELDLSTLLASCPERFAYPPVPQHQPALRDVAVIVDEALTTEAVVTEIRAAGGELLADVRLFDVYRGESIPAGKKSLAYALTYQADRTLKDTEIDKAHKKVEDRLVHVLKASIRGKE